MIKLCSTCMHFEKMGKEEPCASCGSNFDKWKPAITVAKETPAKEENNAVQHPAHYQGKYECIDEMRALFGDNAVRNFCMCSVYEYRFRASKETGEEHEKDIAKAEWYMEYLMKMEDERKRSRQEVF